MPTTRVARIRCFALESITPGALKYDSLTEHSTYLEIINQSMLNKGYSGFVDLVMTDVPTAADTLVIDDGENTDTYEWDGVGANINVAIGTIGVCRTNIIAAINTSGTCNVRAALVGTIVRIYCAVSPGGAILEEGGLDIDVSETMHNATLNQGNLDELAGTKDTYEAHGMITVTSEMLLSDVYIELPFTIKFLWALFPMKSKTETVVTGMTQAETEPYAVTATTKEITIPTLCTATAVANENDVILDLANGANPCVRTDVVYWFASGETAV